MQKQRIFAAAIAGAAALALLGASSASANETSVFGEVSIEHNTAFVSDSSSGSVSAADACNSDGTSCTVYVTVNKRDYNRFVHWCGSTARVVVIPSGSNSAIDRCYGPSTWDVRLFAFIDATNTSDVHVEINVTT